jgi:hypothetical protein
VTIDARRTGTALVRVRYSPYWSLGTGDGCVMQAGQFTDLRLQHPGEMKLTVRFSLGRIGADSPRCS